jgi:hypothetical protein
MVQSNFMTNDVKKFDAPFEKNIELMKSVQDGEEGIDYATMPPGFVDPRKANPKLLEKQIRAEINELKVTDPE